MVAKRHPSRAKTHSKRTVGRTGNDSSEYQLLIKCFRFLKSISLLFTHSICQMKLNFPRNDILRLFTITERERKIGRRVFTSFQEILPCTRAATPRRQVNELKPIYFPVYSSLISGYFVMADRSNHMKYFGLPIYAVATSLEHHQPT